MLSQQCGLDSTVLGVQIHVSSGWIISVICRYNPLTPTNARLCNLCKLSVIYLLLFIAAYFNGNFGISSRKMATMPKHVEA